jgi:hypothetical protein
VNAQTDGHAEEKPAIFSITPTALEYLNLCHESESKNRTKDVSLLLAGSAVAFGGDSETRYSIKIENLVFRTVDLAPKSPESISVTIRGMKCWITPSLLNRLHRSTIDVVNILSTDVMTETKVLILRPTDPIIREIVEPKSK